MSSPPRPTRNGSGIPLTCKQPARLAITETAPSAAPNNRTNRQLVAHLEAVIEEQQAEIEELRRELGERNEANGTTRRAVPRID
jgi:hypothetical protein